MSCFDCHFASPLLPSIAPGGAEHWRQYRDQAAPAGPNTMNIVDKVDELLSSVEFMKKC